MKRLTKKEGTGFVLSDSAAMDEVIRQLGIYETMHEEMESMLEVTEQELEKLRAQSKQKSGLFRELLARKLIYKSVLDQFSE